MSPQNRRFPNSQQNKSRCLINKGVLKWNPLWKPPRTIFRGWMGNLSGQSWSGAENRHKRLKLPRKTDTMLDAAAEVEKAYTDAIQQTDNDPMMDNLPWEVRDKVKSFQVNPQFRENIETLQIPQFFLKVEQSLFTDGSFELLDKEMLAEGFTLKGKAYDIDFAAADDEIREIDVREQDAVCQRCSRWRAPNSGTSKSGSTICRRKAGYVNARK